MKIAILGQYPLDRQRLGGVEVAIAYVQRELLKKPELSLHIITCREELSRPKVVQEDRLTITYLPRKRLGRLTWHLREVRAILRVLKEQEPDIVHAHGTGLYAGAALSSPYPAVVTVHGIASQEARLLQGWRAKLRGWIDSQYERWVIRRTKHLMLITPYVEKVFSGTFRGQSYLVENACEESFFTLKRQPMPGRLLFAGPVIPRKGVLPLLKALRLVRDQVPLAHLSVAGSTTADPDYFAACKAYVHEAGLEGAVTFWGHLPQERVLEEYARCAIFVLPSYQETAPMVIEQAMAAGVPSIATRAGGVPWMLEDGVTGITLPVPKDLNGDPLTLARAILQLFWNPVRAARMGQRAKEEAERRFHPQVVAQRTLEVYQQVLAAWG